MSEDRRITIVRTWRGCRENAFWLFRTYGRADYYCQPVKQLELVSLNPSIVIPPTIEILQFIRHEQDGRWWVTCDGIELESGDG